MFSTDKPQRSSLGHRLVVRSVIDSANYIVDTGSGPTMAFWSGSVQLKQGDLVHGWWDGPSHVFRIRGIVAPESPSVPLGGTSEEVVIDGTSAILN